MDYYVYIIALIVDILFVSGSFIIIYFFATQFLPLLFKKRYRKLIRIYNEFKFEDINEIKKEYILFHSRFIEFDKKYFNKSINIEKEFEKNLKKLHDNMKVLKYFYRSYNTFTYRNKFNYKNIQKSIILIAETEALIFSLYLFE